MKTLVGLVPDDRHAASASEALHAAGISKQQIRTLVRASEIWEQLEGKRKLRPVFRYGFFGAMLGLAAGGLYGIPAGVVNCSEMGCSFTMSTVLLAIIALYWIFAGAFLGTIIGMDRLEQHFYSYVEGVRAGATLLVVDSPDERTTDVTRILQQESALLVHSVGRA